MMISIVIPTYKRADLLRRLLLSIANQTFSDYEVIVVDDSSPNSADYEEVVKWASTIFSEFRYIRLEVNGGAPRARNCGIALARGEWIALVDDDDTWLARKLELQWDSAIRASGDIGLIYTWTRAVDADGSLLYESRAEYEGNVLCHILTTNFIMSPSVMARKEAIDKAGGFDEELPSCQDWDMWIRIFKQGYSCALVREVLAVYHRHGGESVGLSSRARFGYKLFLDKHYPAILRHTSFVNRLKKGWLYFKVRKSALR